MIEYSKPCSTKARPAELAAALASVRASSHGGGTPYAELARADARHPAQPQQAAFRQRGWRVVVDGGVQSGLPEACMVVMSKGC